MKNSSVELNDWRALYQAAEKFRNLRCWEWMNDPDVFGVQNPSTGEIGYGCVMGSLGDLFGLVVYLGREGLENYLKIISLGSADPDPDFAFTQKCLMASFEHRGALRKEDYQVIKELGLKFRGSDHWPLFRFYDPGYFPWFLNSEQVIYLTLVLEQAIDVAVRRRDNEDLLISPEEDLYFVRVPEMTGQGLQWKDEWPKPAPLVPKTIVPSESNMAVVRRIAQANLPKGGTWEIDFFFTSAVVKDDDRPFFPLVSMVVDHNNGMIIHFSIANVSEGYPKLLSDLLKFVEGVGSLPNRILVCRTETFCLLTPVAEQLGIKIHKTIELTLIEEAREHLSQFFMQT